MNDQAVFTRPAEETPAENASGPTPRDRIRALAEVVICSGFPTQLLIVLVLSLFGWMPTDGEGSLSLAYVVTLSLVDASLLVGLVWLFLTLQDEHPGELLLGNQSVPREVTLGILLVPVALLLTAVSFALILQFAPTLRNVPVNPLEALITSPMAIAWFALVAVVAGGIREEIQRAFILHRFEQRLGGAVVGLVVFSVAFGLGHLVQGRDAAIVTGVLGAFWGTVYLSRRSVVAPMVCHGLFNLFEIGIASLGGAGG